MKNTNILLLDKTQEYIKSGKTFDGLEMLLFGLLRIKRKMPETDWKEFQQKYTDVHPVTQLIRQSPFTGRAFSKPRGYPGDAQTLDYIYGKIDDSETLQDPIDEIYSWEKQTLSCRSVRERCQIIARHIDQLAETTNAPRILSIACGHMREAQLAWSIREGKIKELLALDADERSLAVVEAEFSHYNVKPVLGSVRDILKGKIAFSNLDFVYSAGLYDYLSTNYAQALTTKSFNMLKSGGKLLVANFAPTLPDIGYMEALMNWYLIYRDEEDMENLAGNIPEEQIKRIRFFRDTAKNIVYLEIIKL